MSVLTKNKIKGGLSRSYKSLHCPHAGRKGGGKGSRLVHVSCSLMKVGLTPSIFADKRDSRMKKNLDPRVSCGGLWTDSNQALNINYHLNNKKTGGAQVLLGPIWLSAITNISDYQRLVLVGVE